MRITTFLRILAVFVLLVSIGFAVRLTQLDNFFSEAWIDSDIRGKGFTGEVAFVVVCSLATAVGMPRQIVSFLSGYAFGFFVGTCLALLATTIGCITTFSFARFVAQDFVKLRLKNKLLKVDRFLRENPFSMTLLIRFLPAGSNLITSLTAGVSSVSGVPFIVGSAIGFIPQTAIFALAGSGITLDGFFSVALSALLFIISVFLGIYLYRKFRHGKKLGNIEKYELGEKS